MRKSTRRRARSRSTRRRRHRGGAACDPCKYNDGAHAWVTAKDKQTSKCRSCGAVMAANGDCIRNAPFTQVQWGYEQPSGESHPSWTARKEREKEAEKQAEKKGKNGK